MTDNMTPLNPNGTPLGNAPLVVPKKKSGNATNLLLVGAALVAIGGIGFAGGRATAPAAAAVTGFPGIGQGGPTGSFNPGGAPGGGGDTSVTISGTVKSVDGTTLTITTANGTDTAIDTSASTFHAQSAATAADVTVGSTVSVSVSGLGFRLGGNGGGGAGASGAPPVSAGSDSNAIPATDVTITTTP